MNDETLQHLSRIDEQLLQLCNWLNEKRDVATASQPIPIAKKLRIRLSDESL